LSIVPIIIVNDNAVVARKLELSLHLNLGTIIPLCWSIANKYSPHEHNT